MKKIGIDCGANVGNITEKFLSECDTVHAFEPNPHAFKKLKERFLFNPKVFCHENAVLAKEGVVELYFHENSDKDEVRWSTGSSLLNFKSNVLKDKYVEVQAIDICSFISDLNSEIEILKIDVEGVEYEIIHKLIDTGLVDIIKKIHVELHAKKIPELEAKEKELKERIESLDLKNINTNWI